MKDESYVKKIKKRIYEDQDLGDILADPEDIDKPHRMFSRSRDKDFIPDNMARETGVERHFDLFEK